MVVHGSPTWLERLANALGEQFKAEDYHTLGKAQKVYLEHPNGFDVVIAPRALNYPSDGVNWLKELREERGQKVILLSPYPEGDMPRHDFDKATFSSKALLEFVHKVLSSDP